MTGRTLATAAACALVMAAPAQAAMGVHLGVSTSRPQVGERVTVWVFPYWTYTDRDEPAAVPDYPFRLQALGPGGRNVIFRVQPTANPYVHGATFRFPRAGRWELRCANYYDSERHARAAFGYSPGGPRLRVVVTG
jgi:hypothetical protein